MSRLNLGVIFGGRSGEHEVSLMSARSVLEVLNRDRYQVTEIGITHAGEWLVAPDLETSVLEALLRQDTINLVPVTLLADPTRPGLQVLEDRAGNYQALKDRLAEIEVYLPVLHGTFGEDGTLQGLFELADVAYAGAGVVGSAVGMDKGVFKAVMRAHGLPVLDALVVSRQEIEEQAERIVAAAEDIGPYPVFVKPANMGSSVGITKCRSRSDLFEGLLDAARFDRRVLIEYGLAAAREIEVSVLGNEDVEVSIPGEIIPAGDFYSYHSKYHDDQSQLLIPAPLPEEITRMVRDLAREAYRAIDCAGMARVDFLLDKASGKLYLNELNTIPGFTRISMYPKLWEASGLPYPELIDRLIDLAQERKQARDRTVRRYLE